MTIDERTANFKTNCGTCVFAQYNEQNKQNGCDLDRLPLYIKSNRANFDEEKNCFIIDTICNSCRGEQWANAHLGKNLISEVENETKIRLDFILLLLNENIEKIERRLPNIIRQCKNQERIKPVSINIVLKSKDVHSTTIYNMMLDESDKDVKFNLIRILDLSQTLEQCIDAGVKKCKGQYYSIFNLRDNVPHNLIITLNTLINSHLKSVNMVEPYKEFSGLITQTSLHRLFGGNKNLPIYEKIKEAANFQNKTDNIYTWDELWTYQK